MWGTIPMKCAKQDTNLVRPHRCANHTMSLNLHLGAPNITREVGEAKVNKSNAKLSQADLQGLQHARAERQLPKVWCN